MDALFSNIQKSYQENNQQNNQNALLQNQQISQDKINELLNNINIYLLTEGIQLEILKSMLIHSFN